MKDHTELYTCGLEMKGGLNGINYPQEFVKAPKSQYPSNNEDKNVNHRKVMESILHGK